MPIRKRLVPTIDYDARFGDPDTPPFRWLDTALKKSRRKALKQEFEDGVELSPFVHHYANDWASVLPRTTYRDKRLSTDDNFGILGSAIIWNGRSADGAYNDTRQWRSWIERRDDVTLAHKKVNYEFLGTYDTRKEAVDAAVDYFAYKGKKTRPRKFVYIPSLSDVDAVGLANVYYNSCSRVYFYTKEDEVKGYRGKGKLKAKKPVKLRKRLRKT